MTKTIYMRGLGNYPVRTMTELVDEVLTSEITAAVYQAVTNLFKEWIISKEIFKFLDPGPTTTRWLKHPAYPTAEDPSVVAGPNSTHFKIHGFFLASNCQATKHIHTRLFTGSPKTWHFDIGQRLSPNQLGYCFNVHKLSTKRGYSVCDALDEETQGYTLCKKTKNKTQKTTRTLSFGTSQWRKRLWV